MKRDDPDDPDAARERAAGKPGILPQGIGESGLTGLPSGGCAAKARPSGE